MFRYPCILLWPQSYVKYMCNPEVQCLKMGWNGRVFHTYRSLGRSRVTNITITSWMMFKAQPAKTNALLLSVKYSQMIIAVNANFRFDVGYGGKKSADASLPYVVFPTNNIQRLRRDYHREMNTDVVGRNMSARFALDGPRAYVQLRRIASAPSCAQNKSRKFIRPTS